jgi:hypothetical protein
MDPINILSYPTLRLVLDMDLDSDLHSLKRLDPDPHIMNVNLNHYLW